jgi:hypothetical protein
MKLPDEIILFGRAYAILPISPLHAREGTLGLADYLGGVIYLDTSLEPALVMNMLWHELYHIAQQDIQGEINEEEARLVGVFINDVIAHNPEILKCYPTHEHGCFDKEDE